MKEMYISVKKKKKKKKHPDRPKSYSSTQPDIIVPQTPPKSFKQMWPATTKWA